MGCNADSITEQADSASIASSSSKAQAAQLSTDLDHLTASSKPQAQPAAHVTLPNSCNIQSGSSPGRKLGFTEEQGLQEARLKPLQDADFELDFALPPPHPTSIQNSTTDKSISTESPETGHSTVSNTSPKPAPSPTGPASSGVAGSRTSPFALGSHSADSGSSSAQALPALSEADKHLQASSEAQASTRLQPATSPLQTPPGQTPVSRPNSEQEGDPPPFSAVSQGSTSLQGIAKGIQAAIERKLR